jgi:hypothetical protein
MSGSGPISEIMSNFTASTPALRPRPLYPNEPTLLPHSYSDPLPRRKRTHSKQLPHALVISGLEYATDLTQRTFANVLSEKQVILESKHNKDKVAAKTNIRQTETDDDDGAWNLPDGFITVYVCPLNARDRPRIHKTLVRSRHNSFFLVNKTSFTQLDKFAMSSNVFIAQDIRHDFRALPFTPTSRSFHPSYSNPGTPSPSHPMSLPQTFTPPTFTKPLPLPLQSRSSSHFNLPPLPEEILPPSFLKALNDAHHRAHISHTLSLYLADIFSATRQNSRLDATLLTAKASKDAEALIRASRVIGTDLTGMELLRPESDDFWNNTGSQESISINAGEDSKSLHSQAVSALDVSEVDVARIAPRVISHRVRVRDGPEEEILSSALFGATFKPLPKATTSADVSTSRLTVKGLLVEILSEV